MELTCGPFTLEGFSRSTIETYIKVNELNICFDIGKCPMSLVFVPQVFISHFHGDHSLGLTYYIAHRNLAKLEPGKIYVPAAAEKAAHELIRATSALEHARRDYELIPVESGMEIEFKRNLSMRMFSTDHRIPSVGYQVFETRHKLKAEYQNLSQQEIVSLKRDGVEIVNPVRIPRMAYIGDSTIKVFDWHPEILESEILITECTFLTDDHYEEAAKRKHIHIRDIIPWLDHIKSEYIVLMHFSMRYTRAEIKHHVNRWIPEEHKHRILLLI
jgi:ribonuclease Z